MRFQLTRPPDLAEFDAFLSHSSLDRIAVLRVHRRLERYRPPRSLPGRRATLRIFHYLADAPLSPSLRSALANRLSEIGHLVVAASPQAARSPHVEFEIASYLGSHRDDAKIHVALIAGEPPESYPPALVRAYPDPVYADLRGASSRSLPWILWYRRRFNERCLPLIAGLLEVDLDTLLQRERRRRRRRAATLAAVLSVLVTGFTLRYLETPQAAWIQCFISESRSISRAVLLEPSGGAATVRTMALWDETKISDLPSRPHALVNEFDLAGRRTGEYHYFRDTGGEGHVYAAGDRDDWGSLAGAVQAGQARGIRQMQHPPLMRGGSRAASCQLSRYGELSCNGEEVAYFDSARFESETLAAAAARGIPAKSVFTRKFFELGDERLIALAFVYHSEAFGTLSLESTDRGANWSPRQVLPELDAADLVAVAGAGEGAARLYLAFQGEPENPAPNAVFLSDDGGSSWSPVELPKPARNHEAWLLEDLVAATAAPDRLAVSIVQTRASPRRRSVWLTDDAGRAWRPLSPELPESKFLRLVGVASGGLVAGLFHDGLVGGGDFLVTLESGQLAFRQPTPTELRGDLERGRLFLWRPLSVGERLARMLPR